jgi:ribose transport system substrate-binding protein
LQHAAEQHKDLIKQVIITDANDNPTKQVSDIQDLLQRNVDILIVRPSTEAVDAAVVRAIKKGVPVVLGDRRTAVGRLYVLCHSGRLGHGAFHGDLDRREAARQG